MVTDDDKQQADDNPGETQVEVLGLAVLATPLGNLEDLSPRAVRTLKNADLILAEDTRSFSRLASRFGISKTVWSFHEHNEKAQLDSVLARLKDGAKVVLTSEAGTPTISDPGYRLVSACRANGVNVFPIPGPCAAIAALSVSGLETDRFMFEGFLPQKDGKRRSALTAALERDFPTIFYESPHRILKTLNALADLQPDREVFIGRELTKLYEETMLAPAAELLAQFSKRNSIKGEIVLIIRGASAKRKSMERKTHSFLPDGEE